MNNLHVFTATAYDRRIALSPAFGYYKVCQTECGMFCISDRLEARFICVTN